MNKPFFAHRFLLATLALFIPLFFQVQVGAVGIDLTLSPPVTDLILEPGESYEAEVKLINNLETEYTVYTYVRDFYYTDDETLQFVADEELDDPYFQTISMQEWVTIDESFVLEPLEILTVPYKIQVPDEVPPGGRYGAILFGEMADDTRVEGTGVGLGGTIGHLVLVQLPGESTGESYISDGLVTGEYKKDLAEFDKHWLFWKGGVFNNSPVDFEFEFHNGDITHIVPSGYVLVDNMWGIEVASVGLEERRIFPGTSRTIHAETEKKFWIGPYKAKLVVFDAEGVPYYDTQWFVGFPLLFILLVLGSIASVHQFFKYYNRWVIRQHEATKTLD